MPSDGHDYWWRSEHRGRGPRPHVLLAVPGSQLHPGVWGPRSCTVDLFQLVLQTLGVSRDCRACTFLSAEGTPGRLERSLLAPPAPGGFVVGKERQLEFIGPLMCTRCWAVFLMCHTRKWAPQSPSLAVK